MLFRYIETIELLKLASKKNVLTKPELGIILSKLVNKDVSSEELNLIFGAQENTEHNIV